MAPLVANGALSAHSLSASWPTLSVKSPVIQNVEKAVGVKLDLMANIFLYVLKVAGAFASTIFGPSTNFVDIMRISRRGTAPWQKYGAPAVLALRGAVEQYLQIEDLLTRDDGYLMAYKDSYVQECNMIAVAVRGAVVGGSHRTRRLQPGSLSVGAF